MAFQFPFNKKASSTDLMMVDTIPLLVDAKANKHVDPHVDAQADQNAADLSAAKGVEANARRNLVGHVQRFFAAVAAVRVPFIGNCALGLQLRMLTGFTVVMLALAVVLVVLDLRQANHAAMYTELTGELMMHSQRLAKAVPTAVQGNPRAFVLMRESRDRFATDLRILAQGGMLGERSAPPSSARIQPEVAQLEKSWLPTRNAASLVLDSEKILTSVGETIKAINEGNPQLLDLTEQIAATKLQRAAPAREIAEASRLVMLTQRIAKNANELLNAEANSPETAFLLGKDVNTFRDLLDGMAQSGRKDAELGIYIVALQKTFADFQKRIAGLLANQQNITAAKLAQQLVFRDNEDLRERITKLQADYADEDGIRRIYLAAMIVFSLLALLGAVLIAKVVVNDSAARAADAERRSLDAKHQEEEARRVNEANQAAIKRLMDELQDVADGDLTAQATVSEDITGAIADSINYTVEELRLLVGRINSTTAQVAAASAKARQTAAALLAAAQDQSQEIRQTGESVLRMAEEINVVSASAFTSAKVARDSLAAAEEGQRAVENSMTGMDEIRGQIQETAKRIKRLGESSQEVGEIIELISDITEQTNVLALNAAIQAASAGEAGRGFSVVAEEVQRLAERSAEATKQIGALVRTIQTDTQDAVVAMEQSTQGVVEGARLSDAAGQALAKIGSVSRELADLIEDISRTTSSQARSAGGVASSIGHILEVNEQTTEGTSRTADSIRQLALLAEDLKNSVARFKVS